ncbi:ParA family protein [Leptolyngbya sp. FACHB-261]|uniref:ParA family protein n=1 Tax=Leptolyngbya sp. FACHB-261 TaxID=2692806 RepID=UPI0016826827|nr:ParA family protein [Leptolyngbya sp. FACHB-261]MBD2105170.1 ParA family protein [Leptolyngbya sp. FACHB-261]
MPKVLAVVNGKGGVGKTTTSVNIAAILGERFKVLLVDADPQASSAFWVERGEMPFELAQETDPELLVDLRKIKDFDCIIVDTPPSRGAAEFKAVIAAADYVVLPSPPSTLDLKALIETIKDTIAPSEISYRVLLTRVDARAVNEARRAQDTLLTEGITSFNSCVFSSKNHERAALLGKPISQMKGEAAKRAAGDYRRVVEELLREWKP